MNQFVAELRRFSSRRLTRALVLLSLLALVVVGGIVFARTTPAGDLRSTIERREAQRLEDCIRYSTDKLVPDTVIGPGGETRFAPPGTVDPATLSPEEREAAAARCGAITPEQVDLLVTQENFTYTKLWPLPPKVSPVAPGSTYSQPGSAPYGEPDDEPTGEVGWLAIPGLLLFLGALVVGASMIGADWQTGTFPTLLTWETRRTRLFVIKLLAAFVLATVVAAFLLVVFSAVLYPTAAIKGSTAGMTGEWWRGVGLAIGRTSVVAGLGALTGMGIAMLGRRTSLAIGLLALYLIVLENLIRGFRPQWQGWLLGNAITVAIAWRKERYYFADTETIVLHPGRAFAVLGLYALVAVALAAVTFARRDVSAS